MRAFTLLLEPDEEEGGYTVTVPALPGCITQGDTLDEALAMAKDAITGYLASLEAHGEPIPPDTLGAALMKEATSVRRFRECRQNSGPPDTAEPSRLELAVIPV